MAKPPHSPLTRPGHASLQCSTQKAMAAESTRPHLLRPKAALWNRAHIAKKQSAMVSFRTLGPRCAGVAFAPLLTSQRYADEAFAVKASRVRAE